MAFPAGATTSSVISRRRSLPRPLFRRRLLEERTWIERNAGGAVLARRPTGIAVTPRPGARLRGLRRGRAGTTEGMIGAAVAREGMMTGGMDMITSEEEEKGAGI